MSTIKNSLEELHYALGYLNGLIEDKNLKTKNLKMIKDIFKTNSFFNAVETEAKVANETDGDNNDFKYVENDYDYPDPYENYGASTEKYGGYNGYSDDVIDDAFEGDPSLTWNID